MMDRLLENDTVLKVLSVLVAIFLWLQVTDVAHHTVQKQAMVPVPVQWSLPKKSNLTVITLKPTTVNVELQGPSKALSGAKGDTVTAFVNLSGVTRAGVYTLRLGAAVPSGTRTVSISPAQVTVTLDQIGSRRFAVTVVPKGSVAAKYEITKMIPSVEEASISGPMQDVSQVKRVVASVPVSGHTADFEDQSLLVAENAAGNPVPHIEVNPPMVSVASSIRKKPPQVSVGVIARVSGHPASGYAISSIVVDPTHLTVTGPSSALHKLSSVYTSPVDVTGVTGPVSGALPVQLPSGISPVSGSNLVEVTVNVGPKAP